MIRGFAFLMTAACLSIMAWQPAQAPDTTQVEQLESEAKKLRAEVAELKDELSHKIAKGFVLFLFGGFCALWAQNSGRNAWGWFFLGLLFNIITVTVLLYKNAEDRLRSPSRRP